MENTMVTPKAKRKIPTHWGVIDETNFSFMYPRYVDENCETLKEAFKLAYEMIENGAEQVSIARVRFSKRLEVWVERTDLEAGDLIQIDARGFTLPDDDDDGGSPLPKG